MTYSIVRFYKSGRQKVIRRGLTLDEAKAHCSDPSTSTASYFDGFRAEN